MSESLPAGPYDEGMSKAGSTVDRRHRRLLPAYLAAVILGIVGMHTLMQHCPAPQHAMTTAGPHVAHDAGEHMTAPAVPLDDAAKALLAADRPTGGGGDALMLCAAMLLGAGALLTLMLRRRYNRPLTLLRLKLPTWRPPAFVAGTGPPPTLAFAVFRC